MDWVRKKVCKEKKGVEEEYKRRKKSMKGELEEMVRKGQRNKKGKLRGYVDAPMEKVNVNGNEQER